MSRTLAALLGGAAGAVALVGIFIFLWFCLSHNKSISRTSESGSSDPSVQGNAITLHLENKNIKC